MSRFTTYESEGGSVFGQTASPLEELKRTYPELELKKGVITINEN